MTRSLPRRTGFVASALAALCLATGGCGERAAEPAWPAGTLVAARTAPLAGLLERLARLEGTPLAHRARAVREALPACETVEAQAREGGLAAALEGLACATPGSPLALLHELRRQRDAAFALPLAGDARLLGTLAIDASGGVEVDLSLPADALHDARRLLLPGAEPPGPAVLAGDGAIVHARLRPDGGLDLASLVPDRSQAARLFRLKSDLFAGVVLDGTWEAAVYLPQEGREMPDAALALGCTNRGAAVSAMEHFVREIQETWPVRRSFFSVGDAEGACLLDLGVLPELAPCYVATEGALVVGWNPASLRRALARGAAPGPDEGLVVDLARFGEADARLAAPEPAPPMTWPWRRLRADGARRGDAVQLHVVLEGGAGA